MIMKYTLWTQMDDCRINLLKHLKEAMSQRNLFAGDDWIIWERCQLVYRANSWAKAYDIPELVSLAEVEAVESLAVGHVDYASKLTLYVAELIYGQRMPL